MFLTSFTESLMTYALGRRVEYTDMPRFAPSCATRRRTDNRISAFVLGVVNSAAFKMGVRRYGQDERRATEVARHGDR